MKDTCKDTYKGTYKDTHETIYKDTYNLGRHLGVTWFCQGLKNQQQSVARDSMYVCVYVCMYVCMHTHTHTCTHTHAHAYAYTYAHTHTRTHTHTHTRPVRMSPVSRQTRRHQPGINRRRFYLHCYDARQKGRWVMAACGATWAHLLHFSPICSSSAAVVSHAPAAAVTWVGTGTQRRIATLRCTWVGRAVA